MAKCYLLVLQNKRKELRSPNLEGSKGIKYEVGLAIFSSENGIWGYWDWVLPLKMENKVLQNGNGIEAIRADFHFFHFSKIM